MGLEVCLLVGRLNYYEPYGTVIVFVPQIGISQAGAGRQGPDPISALQVKKAQEGNVTVGNLTFECHGIYGTFRVETNHGILFLSYPLYCWQDTSPKCPTKC